MDASGIKSLKKIFGKPLNTGISTGVIPVPINYFGPCHYCGERPDHGKVHHREHFIPKCLGGTDLDDNIVAACGGCNSTKGRRSFEDARIDLLCAKSGGRSFQPNNSRG